MKIKISNYIAARLVEAGICQAFMVTGGGAMHLNDALGHQEGLHCIYNHHEQASAMGAEAYARIHNRIAALCVTTGPGGTNAITGVVGGDGNRPHAYPLLPGESPVSCKVRPSRTVLAGYPAECPGGICGRRGTGGI